MNQDQVEKVLQVQQAGDKRRFGDIALGLGYINDDAIKRYVDYLEKAPTGYWPALQGFFS